MAKNYGRTHYEEIEIPAFMSAADPDLVMIPARVYMRQHAEDGRRWDETATAEKGTWFIAVADNGFIMCCERDPTMVTVPDVDIWQVEHPGPREAIFTRYWDGKEITDAGPT